MLMVHEEAFDFFKGNLLDYRFKSLIYIWFFYGIEKRQLENTDSQKNNNRAFNI